MTQKISSTNIETSTLISLNGPTIANVSIANSTYVLLDDTAVSNAGGYAVITGSNFVSGAQVLFGNTAASAVTFVDSTRLNVQVPALTAGSYVMYIQNPDGSTAIRLNGITSSPIPVWATGSTLTSQVDGVAISISLSASSDSSVTYALANGSSLPSGTTLASNGLFSGTITGLLSDTTYNFTVNAIDAENQDTSRAFSVTVTAGDANFKDTVLLLNGETSNNTWITDVSTNNFAITVNGDTRPVAFSPYETVWSNFFDGTGDYLSTTLTSASPGTGSFTYECWFYVTSLAAVRSIMNTRSGDTADGFDVSILTDGNLYVTYANLVLSNPTSGIVVNRWYHFAIVRNGTTNWNMYLNGVSLSSFTNSSNFTSTTMLIGAAALNATPFLGYISNFRYTRSAVYTSNFTPSTTPLTAIANTSLLTCQSNRLIDNSTNNFTITKNGDVTVSNFGPFAETDLITGSAYFDGSGDYIRKSGSGVLTTNGDVTIECWIYPFSTSIVGIFDGGSGEVNIIRSYGTNKISKQGQEGTGASFTVVANTWQHFACTLSNGNIKTYINGTQSGTGTYTSGYAAGSNFDIGGINATGDGAFNGYISNFRVVNTVVYTGNFTPPNQPLTLAGSSTIYPSTTNVNTSFSSTSTSLLTLQSRIGENNNRFIDTSGLNNFITRSANTSQGTFSPYQRGGWSNFFDGTGDYLTIADNAAFEFGSGNFTIEFWVFPTSHPSETLPISRTYNGTSYSFAAYFTSGTVRFLYNNLTQIDSTATLSLNTWSHIAYVRNSNTLTIYVNGVSSGSASITGSITSSSRVTSIGAREDGNFPFSGYISNARILKGTALYTSNFTAPTLPLTAVANTSILTCADSSFIDDSPNNFTITRNGDVSVQPFSPFKVHTITANTHSVYFDGSGDYLTVPPTSSFDFGTGDFTIECWVYPLNNSGTGIFEHRPGSSTQPYLFYLTSTTLQPEFYTGTSYTSNTSVSVNRWSHVAVSRQSGTLRIFVNGSVTFSGTVTTNLDSAGDPVVIMASFDAAIYLGYTSNLRVVKGTAVYTSAFTPPTSPLTAIANTSLLTCSSNTIVDLSTANTGNTAHAITVNGEARPTTVNPLGFTVTNVTGTSAEYSITNEGGSMYFDGTGDYLNCGSNTLNNLGGNFTVEAWVYRAVSGVLHPIFNHGDYVGSTGILFYITSGNALAVFTNNGLAMSGGTVSPNTWTHVALVRSGTGSGNLKLYLNGISVGTPATNTATFSGTMLIGADLYNSAISNFMNGYISNLRVLKSTALYTSNFIPPTAPLTPIAGTTLLVNGTNGSIIDYSRKNNLESFDLAVLRSNVKKYGNTSIYFAGADDYLVMPYSPNFNFSTGPFTIECWINFNVLSGNRMIFDTYTAASAGGGYQLYWRGTGSSITFYANGVIVAQSSFNTHVTGTWYHVACTRDSSGIVRIFIDGTMSAYASYTSAINIATTSRPSVGIQYITGTNDLDAYIDDLRITKGVARYSSNTSFTPPTQTLPIR